MNKRTTVQDQNRVYQKYSESSFSPNRRYSRYEKYEKRTDNSSRNVRKVIAEELHRPVRRNFVRHAVELKRLHDLYQADLVEMMSYPMVNKATSI